MSMQNVAKLAGVSTSTVSRVVNNNARVAAATVEAVRRAMKQLSFTPIARGSAARAAAAAGGYSPANSRAARTTSVAMLVFGTSGANATPAFEQLLRGVSGACSQQHVNMILSFVSDPSHLPPSIIERRVDGLLLHGEKPSASVQATLESLPTVWLMSNRERAAWGDQVMPDNILIGQTAAEYLLSRGHRELAYLGMDSGSWFMDVRFLGFEARAAQVGVRARRLEIKSDGATDPHGLWNNAHLAGAGDALVEQLLALSPRPTGLFVAEDRLVPLIDAALSRRGLALDRDADIIACNNERPYLMGLSAAPATIDIRAESIGRRGVEQLLWRARQRGVPERVRVMVEPALIKPRLHPIEPINENAADDEFAPGGAELV